MLRILPVLLVLLATSAAQGDPPPSQVDVDGTVAVSLAIPGGTDVHLGESVRVEIRVVHPPHMTAHFPRRPHLGKHLQLIGHTEAGSPAEEGLVETLHALDIQALRTGRQLLAPIEIAFVSGDDATTRSTDLTSLNVLRRLDQATDITLRPARTPRSVEETNRPLLTALIVLAAGAAGGLLALAFVKLLGPALRRTPPPEPPRPAHEVAFERLEELKARPWIAEGNFPPFFTELTGILREYFANRYHMLALGETTTALLHALETRTPRGLELQEVSTLLNAADLVKFARKESGQATALGALDQARNVVEHTLVIDEEETANALPEWEPPPSAPFRLRALSLIADCLALGLLAGVPLTLWVLPISHPWWMPAMAGCFFGLLGVRDLLGRSLGKRLFHLQIVQETTPCDPAGTAARLVRNLPLMIPILGLSAEAAWLLLDPEGRRVGDRWIGGLVVEEHALESCRHVAVMRLRILAERAEEDV